jgi:hypothetical protein
MARRVLAYQSGDARTRERAGRPYGGVSRSLVVVNVTSALLGVAMLAWALAEDSFGVFFVYPVAMAVATAQVVLSVLPTLWHGFSRDVAIRWWEWAALLAPMLIGVTCTIVAIATL